MRRILVTGANGFVGMRLCADLKSRGYIVRAAVRSSKQLEPHGHYWNEHVVVGSIDASTDWSVALAGVDAVVHLAARVHVMQEAEPNPIASYRASNTEGTIRLAKSAAAAGTIRLLYVSTIKVNGERTDGSPFSSLDRPDPVDPYAVSKWEAEQSLQSIGSEAGLETVVVRPPLVYGPGVKGNFLRLMRLVQLGLPLPLGACVNKRSLVYIENITDFLIRCLVTPSAAGQTCLVSDGTDLSTPDLIRMLAAALHRPPRLFSVPTKWLEHAATIIGRHNVFERLCGSLQVDISRERDLLKWQPPVSVREGIESVVRWHLAEGRQG